LACVSSSRVYIQSPHRHALGFVDISEAECPIIIGISALTRFEVEFDRQIVVGKIYENFTGVLAQLINLLFYNDGMEIA
jgi:hypothetical protein